MASSMSLSSGRRVYLCMVVVVVLAVAGFQQLPVATAGFEPWPINKSWIDYAVGFARRYIKDPCFYAVYDWCRTPAGAKFFRKDNTGSFCWVMTQWYCAQF